MPRIRLPVDPEDLGSLAPAMQQGLKVQVPAGISLQQLFVDHWHLEPDFVARRISTIFLDGHPVDDLAATHIRPDAQLALSGAMPGLAGAVLRRGGLLGGLRSGITHQETAAAVPRGAAWISVRLFNLLIRELGPRLLEMGAVVPAGLLPPALASRLPETGTPDDREVLLVLTSPSNFIK
jgi:hypothetical protein